MNDFIIGIDLGTTTTEAAIFRNGKVEMIPSFDGEKAIPSAVGKLSKAREQFAFFLDGIMAFASDNEQNIEATVIEPRHAENPRIFLS